MKLFASIGLLVIVGAVGLGLRAVAFQSDKGAANVFENVENLTLNNPAPQEEAPVLGAISGPDIPSPYLTVGGVTQWFSSMNMRPATTTVCSFLSPAVTSTLDFATAMFEVTSSTASVISIAKSANAFVTTTALASDLSVSADTKAFIFASSTEAINGQRVFAPSQWIVVSMKGGAGGTTFSPTGYCRAGWTAAY